MNLPHALAKIVYQLDFLYSKALEMKRAAFESKTNTKNIKKI